VQQVRLQIHRAVPSASCNERTAAEIDLPALRKAEKAPPSRYYAGLLNGSGSGFSISPLGSMNKDYRRTFAIHLRRNHGLSFDTFAHELGHNHGRIHSFDDKSFPFANPMRCGVRQQLGYGIRSSPMPQCAFANDREIKIPWIDPHAQLLPPTNPKNCVNGPSGNRGNYNDIMSYAYPYWISAYTYSGLAQHIRLVSSW
jgi:hypothetical protein